MNLSDTISLIGKMIYFQSCDKIIFSRAHAWKYMEDFFAVSLISQSATGYSKLNERN